MAPSPMDGMKRTGEVRVTKVTLDGVDGLFFGTPSDLGWQATSGDRRVVIAAEQVKRADWNDGVLSVTHGDVDEEQEDLETFEIAGVLAQYVQQLRMYFESACNTFLHRSSAVVTAQELDLAIKVAEDAAYRVNKTAPGSVARMAKELNLMERLEDVCNRLEQLTRGDKQVLSDIFAANECERIGRVKLILEQCDVQLCDKDARWMQLDVSAEIVKNVLKECGTYRVWAAAHAQDIWLRRAVTVVASDSEGFAGIKHDDEDDDDFTADGGAELREDEAYVPTNELEQMLKEEPAPEEQTIMISAGGGQFSFPLKLAKSLDYWDMFDAVIQRVKARKLLKSGAEIFELHFEGVVLKEDQWDVLRKGRLSPGDRVVAGVRHAVARGEYPSDSTFGSGPKCLLVSSFAAVLVSIAVVCLLIYWNMPKAYKAELDPQIQYLRQRFNTKTGFGDQVLEWLASTDDEDSLRRAAEASISYKVDCPESDTLSSKEVGAGVKQWEQAKARSRVEDVVRAVVAVRSHATSGKHLAPYERLRLAEATEAALDGTWRARSSRVIESLLFRTAMHYAVRGGEYENGHQHFHSLKRDDIDTMQAIFSNIAELMDSDSAPGEVFEHLADTKQVARVMATIFFHTVNFDVCQTCRKAKQLNPAPCAHMSLLTYIMDVSTARADHGLMERVALHAKAVGVEVDLSLLPAERARASPSALWLLALGGAALALGRAHRRRSVPLDAEGLCPARAVAAIQVSALPLVPTEEP